MCFLSSRSIRNDSCHANDYRRHAVDKCHAEGLGAGRHADKDVALKTAWELSSSGASASAYVAARVEGPRPLKIKGDRQSTTQEGQHATHR